MQLRRVALSGGLLAALALGSALPVAAKAVDVSGTASCSGPSVAKIKAGPRTEGMQIDFQVDSNRKGVAWTYAITDNGATVASGTATTGGRSNSFTVRVTTADRPGTDSIAATATNTVTGEVCTGAVSVG